ncbi:polysaccharide biosynthesis/export family protein [Bradyrhizobium sp. CB1650]|uniref:polysaccharide biosynthesis/export family protein n=1 Tax=Bradyrhizobium sp. CB1650 TaxID=3039153 RepID=UPI002434C511|nr:polysaccharide biosynthesis/export family protein [Bradyrhizobium sp. CB1650]WGD49471.1 polysaccharide biosynthesis/export family protein [Bradyrhizobium sp. CB1650]
MLAIVRSCATVLVAVALAGGVVLGQTSPPQKSAPDAARTASSPGEPSLEIGDKLKISFYETIDVGAAKQGGRDRAEPQGVLRTFYQRTDLGGDYTVEPDGAISIPMLGRFAVQGRALEDLRADIAVSFMSMMGRSANIEVKIAERAPVYVLGAVKNPGSYKHVPGMIVLHAVALAGGLDRGENNLTSVIEGVREMERLRSATVQVKQLLVRRARLEAERDGASSLSIPVQLASLGGEEAVAKTFIATENTILRAEQARRMQQVREVASKAESVRNEVEALRRKLEQADAQRDMRLERLGDLQKLKDKGWVTSNNVVTLRTELSDIEARRQDYLVEIAQAETRLADAEEAGPRLTSEDAANLAKAIAAIDREIASAQETMTSAKALVVVLQKTSSAAQAEGYEIVRQSREGPQTFQATETSSLMPGDVLKVIAKTTSAVSPSLLGPAPQSEPPQNRTYTLNER